MVVEFELTLVLTAIYSGESAFFFFLTILILMETRTVVVDAERNFFSGSYVRRRGCIILFSVTRAGCCTSSPWIRWAASNLAILKLSLPISSVAPLVEAILWPKIRQDPRAWFGFGGTFIGNSVGGLCLYLRFFGLICVYVMSMQRIVAGRTASRIRLVTARVRRDFQWLPTSLSFLPAIFFSEPGSRPILIRGPGRKLLLAARAPTRKFADRRAEWLGSPDIRYLVTVVRFLSMRVSHRLIAVRRRHEMGRGPASMDREPSS